jgi:GNAT superfamily N-acetyltransferase
VGKEYQGYGIGTQMLETLESQLPNGTELYFQENQAKEFWEKKGFKPYKLDDGKFEYRKNISHE